MTDTIKCTPDTGRRFELDDADFSATHFTTTGTKIDVFAWRGTQAVGRISGDPMNLTEYGQVMLHVVDLTSGTEGVVAFTNEDDLEALRALIVRADRVADSRNEADDVIPRLRPAPPVDLPDIYEGTVFAEGTDSDLENP